MNVIKPRDAVENAERFSLQRFGEQLSAHCREILAAAGRPLA